MREIKFRAWDKNLKQMVEVMTLSFRCGHIDCVHHAHEHKGGHYLTNGEKDYNLMQYTGQKDRNGKEIYEGDIVREVIWKPDQKEDIRHKIKWYPRNCSFGFSGRMQICEADARDWEVIGNIYENPELIKT